MKVVLVHGKYFNSWEAQGLGYIGAYIRRRVPNIDLVFFQGAFDPDEEILQATVDADWVLFSCTSPTYQWASRLAKQIREGTQARTMLGGYHASAVPMLVGHEFNHVVIGDGERAAFDLISGVTGERFVTGPSMAFHELPWPDRQLIRNERNITVAQRDTGKRITSFQSHRGCPHRCRFCADGARKVFFPSGRAVCRARQIPDLLAEIASVGENYRLDFFKFCDPTWNLNKAWVKEFCYQKTKSTVNLPYFANIHAGLVDEEMMALMAASGCQEIGLGIESGSDPILKLMGKGITKDMVRRVVVWSKKNRIRVRGYFILGTPEETEQDIEETERFADELNLEEYGFTVLCPYPGTDYYYQDPSLQTVDWTETDEYRNDFWHTETISNERLREIQAQLVVKFKSRITQHQREMK